MVLSSKARKESGLAYPIAYAEAQVAAKDPKAFAFNCAQRAQTNFTENVSFFFLLCFFFFLSFFSFFFLSLCVLFTETGNCWNIITEPTLINLQLTPFLGALLISGLKYPIPSAGLGAGWVVSRIIYASGYTSFGPKGRGM